MSWSCFNRTRQRENKTSFFPRERTFFIRACATITGREGEKSFPCDCENRSGDENENSYNAFANVFHECSYVKNANFVHNKLIFPQLSLIGTRTSRCAVKGERVGIYLSIIFTREMHFKVSHEPSRTVINKRNICGPILSACVFVCINLLLNARITSKREKMMMHKKHSTSRSCICKTSYSGSDSLH